ncbi:MAG: hypothetical protein ACRCWF_08420 [Beijerinckiaceae bacterium]
MRERSRTILRLSGRQPDKAPEQKSEKQEAAAVFRRFFYVLERLDKAFRRDSSQSRDEEKRP